jgi:homoserine O-acetyltransferase
MARKRTYIGETVGVVETRTMKLKLPEGGLRLERGGVLPEVTVAYEICGNIRKELDNVVFVCHALTGDAHVAGKHGEGEEPDGWWEGMVGSGRGIDTDRFCVVCANILGGCKGTTGPSSPNPSDDGRPYGSRFPDMTVDDIVEVHALFLRQLGIRRIHAVVGGSFGGMQALALTVRHPEMVEGVVCIATGASLSTQALAFDVIGRAAIVNDADWRGGDYYADGRAPVAGLAQARQLAHITYLSETLMKEKFGRRVRPDVEEASLRWAEAAHSPFEVESYLDHQGDKFVRRFDANSYLCIMRAMDRFDLGGTPEALAAALAPVQARALVVSLSGDWLFSPSSPPRSRAAFSTPARRFRSSRSTPPPATTPSSRTSATSSASSPRSSAASPSRKCNLPNLRRSPSTGLRGSSRTSSSASSRPSASSISCRRRRGASSTSAAATETSSTPSGAAARSAPRRASTTTSPTPCTRFRTGTTSCSRTSTTTCASCPTTATTASSSARRCR